MRPVQAISKNGAGLSLADALGIKRGEVVALVGGGGKTSAMFRLATELAAQGGKVVVTTTTHIYPPDSAEFPALILGQRIERVLADALIALARHNVVVIARELNTSEGRLIGVDPEWVRLLKEQLPATNVLVEADGSKGRPFKAPAVHEPVIPSSADLVVPVVGLSALGRPLLPELVHRAERIASLAAIEIGASVTAAVVASVICHPDGSTRGAPAKARIVPLLNQADDDARLDTGRELARELIERGSRRVVLAALRTSPMQPVREVLTTESDNAQDSERAAVSVIILAAGEGRRMGRLKQALPVRGKSLLRHVVETALATSAAEVLVVLGHRAADLESELRADDRLRRVYNRDYARGQSSSMKAGVNAASADTQAAVFLLADQPLFQPQAIDALIASFVAGKGALLQARYRGVAGHPVLFGRWLFPELLEVTGDQGGREVLARHAAEVKMVDLDLEFPPDIDTVEDYERLIARR